MSLETGYYFIEFVDLDHVYNIVYFSTVSSDYDRYFTVDLSDYTYTIPEAGEFSNPTGLYAHENDLVIINPAYHIKVNSITGDIISVSETEISMFGYMDCHYISSTDKLYIVIFGPCAGFFKIITSGYPGELEVPEPLAGLLLGFSVTYYGGYLWVFDILTTSFVQHNTEDFSETGVSVGLSNYEELLIEYPIIALFGGLSWDGEYFVILATLYEGCGFGGNLLIRLDTDFAVIDWFEVNLGDVGVLATGGYLEGTETTRRNIMSRVRMPEYVAEIANSRSLSGGKIYVGEVDQDPLIPANQKTLYALQEDNTIVAVTQPIECSAGGEPMYNGSYVTLITIGRHSLKILDANDVQKYYIPDSIESSVSGAANGWYLSDYSGVFEDAITAIGSDEGTLFVDIDSTCSSTTAVPENIKVTFLHDATLTVETGVTVTFGYHNQIINTAREKIFDIEGTGTVAYEGVVYPEWWVGIPEDGGDFGVALNQILTNGNVQIDFSPNNTTYSIATTVEIDVSDVTINGNGATISAATTLGTDNMFEFGGTTAPNRINIRDLVIDGNKSDRTAGTGDCFTIVQGTAFTFTNLRIYETPGAVINADGTTGSNVYNIDINKCFFYDNDNEHITINGCYDITISDSYLYDSATGYSAIKISGAASDIATGVVVKDNYLIANGGPGVELGNYCVNAVIKGNYINNTEGSESGVVVAGDSTFYTSITENKITGCTGYGIQVTAQRSIIMFNNLIDNTTFEIVLGSNADLSIISNNSIITSSAGTAISVVGGCDKLQITNNIVRGGVEGLQLLCDESVISGNHISECTTTSNYHLTLDGTDNTIEGNVITSSLGNTGARGIEIDGSNNKLFNNSVYGTYATGVMGFTIDSGSIEVASGNWDDVEGSIYEYYPMSTIYAAGNASYYGHVEIDASGGSIDSVVIRTGKYEGQIRTLSMDVDPSGNTAKVALQGWDADKYILFNKIHQFITIMWKDSKWVVIKGNADVIQYSNTASVTLGTTMPTIMDSTSVSISATMPDGDFVGQDKFIVMDTYVTSSQVSVTNHETSSPEVFTFGGADEYLNLKWSGAKWLTVSGTATAV